MTQHAMPNDIKEAEKPPLRIIGVADLHGQWEQLSRLENVEADLIAFCGDLHNAGTREQARPTVHALADLGLPVLIVPGNMDPRGFVLDLWEEEGLKVLHGRSYCCGSFGFIGLGGMAINNPSRLGDLTRFYVPEEDVYASLAKSLGTISGAASKVVLSHQPPKGIRDTIYNGQEVGSMALRRFVEDFKPHLLICGHIHEDRGLSMLDSTAVINVGEMRKGFAAIIELSDVPRVEWITP